MPGQEAEGLNYSILLHTLSSLLGKTPSLSVGKTEPVSHFEPITLFRQIKVELNAKYFCQLVEMFKLSVAAIISH
jgi:hypothetical protein